MGLDLFDILAVILGVLFTIRKLDAQRRSHKEFPHVAPKAFSDWQERETAAYSLGMFASFSKVLAKAIVVYGLYEQMGYRQLRLVGMSIDLSWLAIVLLTLYRGHRLAKLRSELGIVLGGFVVSSDGAEMGETLKRGLQQLQAGELQTAGRTFHQVAESGDEKQKALALYWLGECFVQQGKQPEAADAFVESLEVDPHLVEPRKALERLQKEH